MGSRPRLPTVLFMLAAGPVGACGSVSADAKVTAYHRQQASDFIAEYEQVRLQGDHLAMCVKSNQVSAAYRDAKDPADAEAWNSKRSDDCRAARNALMPSTPRDGAAR